MRKPCGQMNSRIRTARTPKEISGIYGQTEKRSAHNGNKRTDSPTVLNPEPGSQREKGSGTGEGLILDEREADLRQAESQIQTPPSTLGNVRPT